MWFCILFRFTWEFRFLSYPILIHYLRGRLLLDQRELVVLGPVVVASSWQCFDQPEHCYLQDLEPELGFELQVLKLDFDLPDLELDLQYLCTASTNWSWALGWAGLGWFGASIFSLIYCLTKIYLNVLLTLILHYFHLLILNIYSSSLQVKSIWQILLK